MIVFNQCLSELGIVLIKPEFSKGVQIDQIVFVFFLAYLFQKIKKHLFWNWCFKDLTGHTMKKPNKGYIRYIIKNSLNYSLYLYVNTRIII